MNVGKTIKRICFEITFMLLLVVLMPIHFVHATVLLTIEVAKVYPPIIHDLTIRIFYRNDEKDS